MAKATTIAKVKTHLRICHSALDTDISDQIDACLADLELVGIKNPQEDDPIILNAIKVWCMAYYLDDTAKSAEFMRRYEQMKACLMMTSGYGGGDDEE